MNDNHHASSANIAVILGTIRSGPSLRELPDGDAVAQFDVTTTTKSGGRNVAASVPVAWSDPTTAQLARLVSGADVLVIGTVRRRFFRLGGATQSRTEVVADAVVPVRQRKRIAAALHEAADRVLDLAA
ncbi:MAG TPA: single-stranded DNA-binding protein [Ilumatobacteraceae bacterium]|nr:single-stranded DNA-binding protein [Ilumatobacteraceae bacterium]